MQKKYLNANSLAEYLCIITNNLGVLLVLQPPLQNLHSYTSMSNGCYEIW